MKGSLTVTSASITLITSMLGAGINFMPSGFQSIGYVNSIIVMSIITCLTFFTLYAISYAASQEEDMQDMSYASLGYKKSYYIGFAVDTSILLALCLVCLAFFNYIVIVAVLLFTGQSKGGVDYSFYKMLFMTIIMAVFYFLALQKNLSSLKITSYACVASVAYLIVLLIVLNLFVKDKISKGSFVAFNTTFSRGLPIILLAFSCQINMVQVYKEMKERTTKNVLAVSLISSIVGGIIYFTVGFLGYHLFGETANGLDMINIFCDKSSILNKILAQDHPNLRHLPSVAVFGAMVVLVGSFPLQVNPAASTIVKLIGQKGNAEKQRKVIVSILCLSIYLINLYPDLQLDLLLGIVGAVFNNMLSYIFPCLYFILTCKSFGPLSFVASLIILASFLCGSYILYIKLVVG